MVTNQTPDSEGKKKKKKKKMKEEPKSDQNEVGSW